MKMVPASVTRIIIRAFGYNETTILALALFEVTRILNKLIT